MQTFHSKDICFKLFKLRQCDLVFDTEIKSKMNYDKMQVRNNYSRVLVDDSNRDFFFINLDMKGDVYLVSGTDKLGFIEIKYFLI